jgi:hypothetical protein
LKALSGPAAQHRDPVLAFSERRRQMEHKRGDFIHDQRVGTEKNVHSQLSSLNRTACARCKKCSESPNQNIHLKAFPL